MKKDEEAVAQEKRLKERMGRVKHKIMVMSGKGGVRKTVAVNLAHVAKGVRSWNHGCRHPWSESGDSSIPFVLEQVRGWSVPSGRSLTI